MHQDQKKKSSKFEPIPTKKDPPISQEERKKHKYNAT